MTLVSEAMSISNSMSNVLSQSMLAVTERNTRYGSRPVSRIPNALTRMGILISCRSSDSIYRPLACGTCTSLASLMEPFVWTSRTLTLPSGLTMQATVLFPSL